jgi:hypothetical protein
MTIGFIGLRIMATTLRSSSHVAGAALGEDGHESEDHSRRMQHRETPARTHLGRSGP